MAGPPATGDGSAIEIGPEGHGTARRRPAPAVTADAWCAKRRWLQGEGRRGSSRVEGTVECDEGDEGALTAGPPTRRQYVAIAVRKGTAAPRGPTPDQGALTLLVACAPAPSEVSAAMKASGGTSTEPMFFIRFLPAFCFSSSLRLREMSPP